MSSWATTESILSKKIDFEDKVILDIGCGNGWFSVWSFSKGAKNVFAIDPIEEQIEMAKRNSKYNINFKVGFAEDLPFENNKFDLIFFFNSLHHVSLSMIKKALNEGKRVTKKTGCMFIIEPLSTGTFNEILKLVDDEKNIRAKAYYEISNFYQNTLTSNEEIFYEEKKEFNQFSEFCNLLLSADPKRKDMIGKTKDKLINKFNRLSKYTNNKYQFIQPMRMNIIKFNKK